MPLDRSRKLRFGIVGLGAAVTHILPNIASRPYLALTAAADVRPEALAKFRREYGGETYERVEDLCQSPSVDVVYVASPNPLHVEHVVVAAQHGKHVIVEKPMALTIDECEAMNAAAERHGVYLVCAHTHSYGPPIRKMREVIRGGELGALRMISTWHFNDWIYRPRAAWELDPARGGNLIYRQGSHQVDIVRLLGGGLVRSVRAMSGVWDPSRRAEGAYAAYLEFEDGTPATLVYNSYAHFDTAELTEWVGEGPRDPDYNLRVRRKLATLSNEQESALKEAERYGGPDDGRFANPESRPYSMFGIIVASCEHGDVRQTPRGLMVYGDDRKWEIPVTEGARHDVAALEEMYDAVVHGRPVGRSGRWGMATLEVILAIIESTQQRQEIFLKHQVASPE